MVYIITFHLHNIVLFHWLVLNYFNTLFFFISDGFGILTKLQIPPK